jgi:hypothetical protein
MGGADNDSLCGEVGDDTLYGFDLASGGVGISGYCGGLFKWSRCGLTMSHAIARPLTSWLSNSPGSGSATTARS